MTKDPAASLQYIENLMRRSSRFISLSGLSGIVAGLWALGAAWITYAYLGKMPFQGDTYWVAYNYTHWGWSVRDFLLTVALLTMAGAIGSGLLLTMRKARKAGQDLRGPLSRRFAWNLALPLIAGGTVILSLLLTDFSWLPYAAPLTLVFYGLALFSGGQLSMSEVQYLGICEIALGIVGIWLPAYGLDLWIVGFGLLHILYGSFMWYKYDREPA